MACVSGQCSSSQLTQWRDRAGFSPNFQVLREPQHSIANARRRRGTLDLHHERRLSSPRDADRAASASLTIRAPSPCDCIVQVRLRQGAAASTRPRRGYGDAHEARGRAPARRTRWAAGGRPTGGVSGTLLAHPSAILLVVQLLRVLIYPFMDETGTGAFSSRCSGHSCWHWPSGRSVTQPGPTWIAVTLAVAASGLSIADAINPTPALDVASAVSHALFYFWAAGSLMVYMLSDRTVTTDELFAVGATFTLVAWGFAYVFEIMQTVQPGCFTAAVNPEQPRTWMELLFLSFTNLSSTGLSDVVPITGQARSVVMFEQLAGLGYVALFVSRLVGLTVAWQMIAASGGRRPGNS